MIAFPRINNLGDLEELNMFFCLRNNLKFFDPQRERLGDDHSLLSHSTYVKLYGACRRAIYNTHVVSRMCSLMISRVSNEKKFFQEENRSTRKRFVRTVFTGLLERGLSDEKYIKQLIYESRVVLSKDMHEYFLLVHESLNVLGRKRILVGPRGSAAGALLSYVLRVTHIDPLRHNLFFDRFLNRFRDDMPDYDLDVPSDLREEIISDLSAY